MEVQIKIQGGTGFFRKFTPPKVYPPGVNFWILFPIVYPGVNFSVTLLWPIRGMFWAYPAIGVKNTKFNGKTYVATYPFQNDIFFVYKEKCPTEEKEGLMQRAPDPLHSTVRETEEKRVTAGRSPLTLGS